MNNRIIHCLPGNENFNRFQEFSNQLYSEGILKRNSFHQTENQHLVNCFLLLIDEVPVARAAVYINPALNYNDLTTACVGSYECIADENASQYLLEYIKEWVKEKNISWLIGPMEGSTWNSYRFSDHNRHVNFLMEPYHHDYYGQHFKNAGFSSIANYVSNLDKKLEYDKEKLEKFEQHYLQKGAIFRNLNMDDFENDLYRIAEFSIEAFAQNFLYTPISPKEFVDKYMKFKTLFDPRLVWIVEDVAGETQAFLFAIKDHLDPTGETLIFKSMANKKDSTFRGIGTYLARKSIQIGKEMGYKKIIHALMIADNDSLRASEKFSQDDYKAYTLYGVKI